MGGADLSSVAVRQRPMRVNLRARDLDRAGPLVVRENQSRRDLTKVAQYELLGWRLKKRSVPDGTFDGYLRC
jgi:hypothetical protein